MRRGFAIALIALGMMIALAGGFLGLAAWIGQTDASARWDRDAAQQEPSATNTLTRLTFPAQGKNFFVEEGASEETLLLGPARVEWSGVPGGKGNAIIAGHRDTHFRILKEVRKGDLIDLERRGQKFQYRIVALEVVKADDQRFYQSTTTPVLTLVTCYPFYYLGRAPKRFIVRAELLESNS